MTSWKVEDEKDTLWWRRMPYQWSSIANSGPTRGLWACLEIHAAPSVNRKQFSLVLAIIIINGVSGCTYYDEIVKLLSFGLTIASLLPFLRDWQLNSNYAWRPLPIYSWRNLHRVAIDSAMRRDDYSLMSKGFHKFPVNRAILSTVGPYLWENRHILSVLREKVRKLA